MKNKRMKKRLKKNLVVRKPHDERDASAAGSNQEADQGNQNVLSYQQSDDEEEGEEEQMDQDSQQEKPNHNSALHENPEGLADNENKNNCHEEMPESNGDNNVVARNGNDELMQHTNDREIEGNSEKKTPAWKVGKASQKVESGLEDPEGQDGMTKV